jgi:hypothetical protein
MLHKLGPVERLALADVDTAVNETSVVWLYRQTEQWDPHEYNRKERKTRNGQVDGNAEELRTYIRQAVGG